MSAKLQPVNTDVIGTVWKDAKDLPQTVIGEKHKPGDPKAQYERNVEVMCLKWKDKHDVYMTSTCVGDNISNVTRKGKVKQVPETIETYNSKMGRVNKSHEMLTSYKLKRKRFKNGLRKKINIF